MDKVVASAEEAVADIPDGATIMIGGQIGAGIPHNLVHALVKQGARDLTIVSNASIEPAELAEGKRIKKVICGFVSLPGEVTTVEKQYLAGEIAIELIPQGTLCERIRAGGAGIPALYMSPGVGTITERGNEKRVFDGQEYLLETALRADFALIKAYAGDRMGNLTYRMAARNINPTMAPAARVTIAEVERIVEAGGLDPETIVTPGIFVDRVVVAEKGKLELKQWYRRRSRASP